MAALHARAFAGQGRAWSAAEFADLLASSLVFAVGDTRGFALGRVIADEAEVAEVTLYRKFRNKRALFEAAVRTHLEPSFTMDRLDPAMESETFFKTLFEDRIETLSKHRRLMQLVIRESLSGNLPDDLKFVSIVHASLEGLISEHIDTQGYAVESSFVTRTVVGVLISYILFPSTPDFSMMETEEKKRTVDTHVAFILRSLER